MNIFEDLIEELKEENLIEETVIKTASSKESQPAKKPTTENENTGQEANISPEILEVVEISDELEEDSPIFEAAELMAEPLETEELEAESFEVEDFNPLPSENVSEPVLAEKVSETVLVPAETSELAEPAPSRSEKKENSEEIEFYRKRATEEVSFLQMVESAFAGIERDQLKIVPTLYDDLEVKKVLHSYLQILPKSNASERSQAEFQLMQATENWYSTLAGRDKRMMAAHLRRYCETSRPPLSMPALVALARFYRNAPYTETVRSKFDLMITRIFSREDYTGRRELKFERDELIGHIKDLYAEWSSVPLYSTDEDDEGIAHTVAQFDEFVREAEAIESFDSMINGNFFNRLRQFKESTNEDFYAPPVIAAAIVMNVEIGNQYIELLERATDRDGAEVVESRYSLINEGTVSETMGKTMSLTDLLAERQMLPEPEEEEEEFFEIPSPPKPSSLPVIVKTKEEIAIEKNTNYSYWLFTIAGTIILLIVLYFGAGFFFGSEPVVMNSPVEIENSILKDYLKSASIEEGTLRGIVLPSWDKMTSDDRKQALTTMMTFGGEKGYHRIELFNKNQKVGVADDGGVFVVK